VRHRGVGSVDDNLLGGVCGDVDHRLSNAQTIKLGWVAASASKLNEQSLPVETESIVTAPLRLNSQNKEGIFGIGDVSGNMKLLLVHEETVKAATTSVVAIRSFANFHFNQNYIGCCKVNGNRQKNKKIMLFSSSFSC
jgi:hypothetical protein